MWGAVRSPFRLNLMLLGAFKTSFFLFRSLPLVGATMAPRRRGGIGCRRPQRRPRWWWRRCLLQRHVYSSTTFSRQRLAVRSLPQLQNARHPWAIYSSLPQPDPCLYVRPAPLPGESVALRVAHSYSHTSTIKFFCSRVFKHAMFAHL